MYSVFAGSLRSTNEKSFFRLRHRSFIRDCKRASARGSPFARGLSMTVLKTSACSMPPVMCKNLSNECKSRMLLTLRHRHVSEALNEAVVNLHRRPCEHPS